MGEMQDFPYKILGGHIRKLRQKSHETVADVAGAVEIEEDTLKRIEQGTERPSEDILMLLINHFSMHEDDATNLWLLAGYDTESSPTLEPIEDSSQRSVVVMMALDMRILYTNQVKVTADKQGVVLTFLQHSPDAPGNMQKLPISRIGMSYEQAHDLLQVLHKTLVEAAYLKQPKRLPGPRQDKSQ